MPVRPAFILPQIPSFAKAPPKGEAWLHEPKWDGFRFQIIKNGRDVRLCSRNGAEYTDRLPGMVEVLAQLPDHRRAAILDGELCLIDAGGTANFYRLMREMRTRWPDEAALMFMVFCRALQACLAAAWSPSFYLSVAADDARKQVERDPGASSGVTHVLANL